MPADVLVIGAGPAGSSLACRLAQAGFCVVVADRAEFPRDKPCGEFLSPECQPYLAELGYGDPIRQLGAVPVTGMRLSGYGTSVLGHFRQLADRAAHGHTGFGLRRVVLDHALLMAARRAGATFLARHEFVGLLRDGERVVGARLRGPDGSEGEHRARFVVGADGVHSRVAKALGVQRRIAWLDQFALVTHFEHVPVASIADVQLLAGGFLAATSVDDGRYSVNVVVPRRVLRTRTSRDWDEFFAAHLGSAPQLAAALHAARRSAPWRGTGPFGFRTTTTTVPGAMLVGDAAGYVDPMTGEGIYFALFAAKAAAAALAAGLQDGKDEAAAMARYRRLRARELGPRMLLSRWLQRGIRHPWLVRGLLRTLARLPSAADLLVTMTGDTIHPHELWRPAFWRTWRTAS